MSKRGESLISKYEMTDQQIVMNEGWGIVTGKVSLEGRNNKGGFQQVY